MWPDADISRKLLLQSVVVDEATIPPDMTIAEWRSRRAPAGERPIGQRRRRLSRVKSAVARRLAS
jgi:hypothetical protein